MPEEMEKYCIMNEEEYRDNVKNYGFSLFVLCNKYIFISYIYMPSIDISYRYNVQRLRQSI